MSVQQPSLRRRKTVLKVVEDLDVFPKAPEECIESTSYGGTASIVAVVVIIWLVILEVNYFLDTGYKFNFSPDTDLDAKLTINVDISVAMPCGIVGADIVDSTNQNVVKFGELEEEYIHFALSAEQRAHFNQRASFNTYLREESHSLKDILWKNNFLNFYREMPKMSKKESHDRGVKEACRMHGKLELNKVAGNFHITAGKTLPLSRGHAHIAAFMSEGDYNFSHRITRFSFGESSHSIILPLEGDERIAHSNHMLYTYFIQVVPTIVKTRFSTYQTYQYSVRELEREIDHDKGSHGISGIFFKYDMSGLKVEVTEENQSVLEFLIRLCAIIGGVYATVGMLYTHISLFGCQVRFFSKRFEDENLISSKSNKHHSQDNLVSAPLHNPLNFKFQNPILELGQPQVVPFTDPKVVPLRRDSDSLPDILSSHGKT